MAVEVGASRDEAIIQQARECTRWKNTLMLKVALTVKKNFRIRNYTDVQGATSREELVGVKSEHLCEPYNQNKTRQKQ